MDQLKGRMHFCNIEVKHLLSVLLSTQSQNHTLNYTLQTVYVPHIHGYIRITTNMYIFGLWEEAGGPIGSPNPFTTFLIDFLNYYKFPKDFIINMWKV